MHHIGPQGGYALAQAGVVPPVLSAPGHGQRADGVDGAEVRFLGPPPRARRRKVPEGTLDLEIHPLAAHLLPDRHVSGHQAPGYGQNAHVTRPCPAPALSARRPPPAAACPHPHAVPPPTPPPT